jgi:hypothetical protein
MQRQPRDEEICRLVYKHRFLQLKHFHALLGRGKEALRKRLALLTKHDYLERPKAQRSSRAQTEQIIYGIGLKGAKYLSTEDPVYKGTRISGKDLVDTARSSKSYIFLDHDLAVAEVMVAMHLACEAAGYRLLWDGQPHKKEHRLVVRNDTDEPDAFFTLQFPAARRRSHYFLEYDRANVSTKTMRERYHHYFEWAKTATHRGGWAKGVDKFRVLTVTTDARYMERLQHEASYVGDVDRYGVWGSLRFTHVGLIPFEKASAVFGPVFYFAKRKTEPQHKPASIIDAAILKGHRR